MSAKTPKLFQKRMATPAELSADMAAPQVQVNSGPGTGQVRNATDTALTGHITPQRALRAMRAAHDQSDIKFFVETAMEVLRRSPHAQSLIVNRTQALTRFPLKAEPGGKSPEDLALSDYAQSILESEAVEAIVPTLQLEGVWLGFSLAQNFVNTANSREWTLEEIRHVPPKFLTFSKHDGLTPMLLPGESGLPLQELPVGKYIYHRPGIIPGNPATSGAAYAAIYLDALKNVALHGWNGYMETNGQPIRMGYYPDGMDESETGKANLSVMRKGLQNLGRDAWAMLPASMKIEFEDAANKGGSIDVYERLCRYEEELIAKLIEGGQLVSGTGNTGSGGSQALGKVQSARYIERVKADGKALALTLRSQLIKPFCTWNFPNAKLPRVYFNVEDKSEVSAKVKAICDLVDRGLRVSTNELYSLLDLRTPTADEETVGGPDGVKAAKAAVAAEDEAAKGNVPVED